MKSKGTILVTGATGFIGQALTSKLLSLGYKVRCFVRNALHCREQLQNSDVEIIEGDLMNNEACLKATRGVSCVIHLAAIIPSKKTTPEHMKEINVLGTQKIFESSVVNKVEHFVLMSTAFIEWGETRTDYEKSKIEAEKIVGTTPQGITQITILRPGFIYGPGAIDLLPLFTLIKKRLFFYIGSGNNKFELNYIDDVVKGILEVIHNPITYGKILVISEKTPKSFKDVVREIASLHNVEPPFFHLPKVIASCLVAILKPLEKRGIRLPLNSSSLKTFTRDRVFHPNDLLSINKDSNKTSLREGLGETISYYQHKGLL